MASKNLETVVIFKTPRTLEAFHEAQETLEDVGEVDQEPLEAHEVRETPLEHENRSIKSQKTSSFEEKFCPKKE